MDTLVSMTGSKQELLRIVLDTPNDTHMFCGSEHNVLVLWKDGVVDVKKAKDLVTGDIISGEGEVVYVEKV